ncbi:hypothetical protein ACFPRL_27055 [Pseudoclavibacter helvolus]
MHVRELGRGVQERAGEAFATLQRRLADHELLARAFPGSGDARQLVAADGSLSHANAVVLLRGQVELPLHRGEARVPEARPVTERRSDALRAHVEVGAVVRFSEVVEDLVQRLQVVVEPLRGVGACLRRDACWHPPVHEGKRMPADAVDEEHLTERFVGCSSERNVLELRLERHVRADAEQEPASEQGARFAGVERHVIGERVRVLVQDDAVVHHGLAVGVLPDTDQSVRPRLERPAEGGLRLGNRVPGPGEPQCCVGVAVAVHANCPRVACQHLTSHVQLLLAGEEVSNVVPPARGLQFHVTP